MKWALYNEAAALVYRLEAVLDRTCPFAQYMKFTASDTVRLEKIHKSAWQRAERRLREYRGHLETN